MKIVCISDTHTRHEGVLLPECDISIFSGDYSNRGSANNTIDFLQWYSKQSQCRYKIWVNGNHDLGGDPKFDWETNGDLWWKEKLSEYSDLIYLENSGIVVEGLNIWGSPVTPWFHGDYWAYNMHRGRDKIGRLWETIPTNTDILITHGPPYGVMDFVERDMYKAGCEDLRREVLDRIKPRYHVFGHIHLDNTPNRIETIEGTTFINASLLNNSYKKVIDPIVIEYEKDNN